MSEKELWLQNLSGLDVNLSDLGVQVPAFKTVNVYKVNPYVTDIQVQKSLESGSIFKRLQVNVLKVVEGYTNPKPHTLDHVKASTQVVDVVKAKSSVIIDTKEMDVVGDEELGDIANYGFEPDKNLNVRRVKTDDGSVVVEQKVDEAKDDLKAPTTKIESAPSMTDQSTAIMVKQIESITNPVGPISEAITPPQNSYVVKPPVPEVVAKVETVKSVKLPVSKQDDGVVSVKGVNAGSSLKLAKELNELATKMGVSVEDLPKDLVEKLDAEQVIKTDRYDTKVATKDESGSAVIMKIKEEATDKED